MSYRPHHYLFPYPAGDIKAGELGKDMMGEKGVTVG
jgi:hypothetical protein